MPRTDGWVTIDTARDPAPTMGQIAFATECATRSSGSYRSLSAEAAELVDAPGGLRFFDVSQSTGDELVGDAGVPANSGVVLVEFP